MVNLFKYIIFLNLIYILVGCDQYPGISNSKANQKILPTFFYDENILKIPSAGDCNIDRINNIGGAATFHPIKENTKITIDGWAAISAEQGILPDQTFLVLYSKAKKSTVFFMPVEGVDRPDVAKAFGNSRSIKSGFSGQYSINRLNSGPYDLMLIMKSDDKFYRCGPVIEIEFSELSFLDYFWR